MKNIVRTIHNLFLISSYIDTSTFLRIEYIQNVKPNQQKQTNKPYGVNLHLIKLTIN